MQSLRQLKAKAAILEPVVRIGKSGLTDSLIKEINMQLKKKKLVKIKLLKAIIEKKDRKKLAKELAAKTNARLVQQIGGMVVLYKK